jgi:Spy/CpxP family protein refolding chaperone
MMRTALRLAPVALLTSTMLYAQQTPAPAATPAPIVRNTPAMGPGGPQGFRGGEGMDGHGMRSGRMRFESGMGPMGMWWKNPEVVQRVGLTPEQTGKMEEIFQKSRLQLIDLKANVERQEVTLEPLLDANPVDTKKTLLQIGKVADARAELEKANAGMLLGIRGVLTPEQWTKLHADGRRHGEMMKGGRPDGMPGGGGMAMRGNEEGPAQPEMIPGTR